MSIGIGCVCTVCYTVLLCEALFNVNTGEFGTELTLLSTIEFNLECIVCYVTFNCTFYCTVTLCQVVLVAILNVVYDDKVLHKVVQTVTTILSFTNFLARLILFLGSDTY